MMDNKVKIVIAFTLGTLVGAGLLWYFMTYVEVI